MKSLISKWMVLPLLVLLISNVQAQQALPQLGKSSVADVVKAMTLEEKINLLVGQIMYVPGMPMPGSGLPPSEPQRRVTGAAGATASGGSKTGRNRHPFPRQHNRCGGCKSAH
jgi:beta-glucosidase